uniref:DYW domain-containing protein n=2 Tax=Fagus sylvatica TaxID=28930 RepID=A0A2N9EQT4_FAGSY
MRFQGYDMLLNECVNQRAIREGQRVHTHMIKTSYLPPVYLRTRLIIFYCKCETLGDARQVLDEMPERNVVSWTAMISAYSQTGYASEALNLFVQMLRSVMLLCMEPNEFTFATVLTSCIGFNGLNLGRQVHSFIIKTSFESHIYVGSSLLDMYAKAGQIHAAQGVFESLPERDVVSCTAIISGYAQLGLDEEALELFPLPTPEGSLMVCLRELLSHGMQCSWGIASMEWEVSHGGMEERWLGIFYKMENGKLGVEPKIEHYGCVVDLLGRAGQVEEAFEFIKKMPFEPTAAIWGSLLAHPRREEVFAKVRELSVKFKEVGYVPDLSCVLHDVDEEQKEKMLLGHSEKLALAFGLIVTPKGVPVCVIKNLRICVDCHNFAKFVSKVISAPSELDDDATVDQLIDRGSMIWKDDLITRIFCQRDVEIIQRIPLSSRMNHRLRPLGSQSRISGQPFGQPRCPLKLGCSLGRPAEISSQLRPSFLTEDSQTLFPRASVPTSFRCDVKLSFKEFVAGCIAELQSPALEISFTTAWALWNARNETYWDAKVPIVDEIYGGAAALALDFLENGSKGEGFHPCATIDVNRWHPPKVGYYKLNVACKCSSSSSTVGVGIIIRDSLGLVAAVMETTILGCGNMLQNHAEVAQLAIKFAYDMGFRRLEVDLGCLDLFNLVQQGSPHLAYIGVLVDDLCGWVPIFQDLSFSYIQKSCNRTALVLATEAASSISLQVWLEIYYQLGFTMNDELLMAARDGQLVSYNSNAQEIKSLQVRGLLKATHAIVYKESLVSVMGGNVLEN